MVFNQGDVAPMSEGMVEFTVSDAAIADILIEKSSNNNDAPLTHSLMGLFVFTFLSSSYTPKVRIPLSYETVC
ncbi:RsiV family protein [Extibacter muris]|uniref:RsiV family protein n=1 Tax=Extibacter muris TaxID=1796622 RepID=UPI001FAAA50B|nr:RsiV family protein [Extibacter muris]MCU0078027.1 RsiV family protein [Extibacter muris]